MMNEIQIFNYNSAQVRVIEQDGSPWWVLKDVCDVLGLGTPARVAERLDEDEVSLTHLTDSLGRQQNTTIINESGLYSVILRSDKPEAKPFRKWVTSEVLPSIRKTGQYVTPEANPMPRAQSVSEVVNLGKFIRDLLKDQGATPNQTAELVLDTMRQFGVNLSGKLMLPVKLDKVKADELDMVEFAHAFPNSTWEDCKMYRTLMKLSR